MRALITGAGGFVGGHLCQYLLACTDWELWGTVYPEPVEGLPPQSRVSLIHLDLRDGARVAELMADFRPDVVFHLAAQSYVPTSFSDPWETLENNLRAQLNVLEGVRQAGLSARVIVIGSNEEYGWPRPEDLPLTEESPLRPVNPYAVSKVGQDFLGLQYHLAYGMDVVRLRPFNHTGPGQSPRFVVPAFARQIARIEAGLQEPIVRVGNLDVARDFTDVRDIVRAYYLAATKADAGEVYNLASGVARPIRWILETLLSFTDAEVRVEVDPALYRPADAPVIYGSAEKFRHCTGWEPQIPFEQTLRDTLQYWRRETQRGG
ncbi:MAG: GDP-mannose 4,6-dehydratase [Anaerolineae bacterium]|nr:GDP-mannose 4,6-dehydratase [Anaerolineae bacterium]